MKRLQTLLLVFTLAYSPTALGSDAKCRQIAQREYPDDARMQEFVFNKQVAAYRHMTTTATDQDARAIALREYPEDFSMQQFTYDKQLAAKRYMAQVTDREVKGIATREYSDDFSMQKFTYDKQTAAKAYMRTVQDTDVKRIALGEYSQDYSMQKFTYDKQLAARPFAKNNFRNPHKRLVRPFESFNTRESLDPTSFQIPIPARSKSLKWPWIAGGTTRCSGA